MISANNGHVVVKGSGKELILDWMTITHSIYEAMLESGNAIESINELFIQSFFTCVATVSAEFEGELPSLDENFGPFHVKGFNVTDDADDNEEDDEEGDLSDTNYDPDTNREY